MNSFNTQNEYNNIFNHVKYKDVFPLIAQYLTRYELKDLLKVNKFFYKVVSYYFKNASMKRIKTVEGIRNIREIKLNDKPIVLKNEILHLLKLTFDKKFINDEILITDNFEIEKLIIHDFDEERKTPINYNFINKLKKLTYLEIQTNQYIDLSQLTNLKSLNFALGNINFGNLQNIHKIRITGCFYNLNFSNILYLKNIEIYSNIDFYSTCKKEKPETIIDLSKNKYLERIRIDYGICKFTLILPECKKNLQYVCIKGKNILNKKKLRENLTQYNLCKNEVSKY